MGVGEAQCGGDVRRAAAHRHPAEHDRRHDGFLFWQLHLPLALLAIIVFLIGAVCGLALVVYVNLPKKPRQPELPEEPEAPEEKPDDKGAEAAGEDSEK